MIDRTEVLTYVPEVLAILEDAGILVPIGGTYIGSKHYSYNPADLAYVLADLETERIEGTATPDNPEWIGMTSAEVLDFEFGVYVADFYED